MKTKGIEPIVAAVLLIVVAVIGAVLTYLWYSGYVTRATSQAEQLSSAEQLKIEAIETSTSGGGTTVTIHVRNVGSVPITVDSAYVLDAIKLTAVCKNTGLGVTVDPGSIESSTISVNCGTSLTSGERYIAKVVTTRGTEAASVFIAP